MRIKIYLNSKISQFRALMSPKLLTEMKIITKQIIKSKLIICINYIDRDSKNTVANKAIFKVTKDHEKDQSMVSRVLDDIADEPLKEIRKFLLM